MVQLRVGFRLLNSSHPANCTSYHSELSLVPLWRYTFCHRCLLSSDVIQYHPLLFYQMMDQIVQVVCGRPWFPTSLLKSVLSGTGWDIQLFQIRWSVLAMRKEVWTRVLWVDWTSYQLFSHIYIDEDWNTPPPPNLCVQQVKHYLP